MLQLFTTLVSALALTIVGAFGSIPAFAGTSTQEFVTEATNATNFEIASSKIALERSKDPRIIDFANKMINDHTVSAAKMIEAMKTDNLDAALISTTIDEKHQKILDKLNQEKPEKFDEVYAEAQENAHNDAVKLFKDYADDGEHAALKAYAGSTVPTLELHKEHADKLESKVD